MPDAENLRLPQVSRFVPYPVAREVPGEGHQLKLQPGPVICVQSPCPVSLSVLQKALTLSLHLNPMACPLSGRMWARVRPALRLTSLLRLDTGWHFLLQPLAIFPTCHDSKFCMLASHLVEVQCLHRACLYLHALLTTWSDVQPHVPTSPHLPGSEKTASQNLTVLLCYCSYHFIYAPTPKWMQGLPRRHTAKESTCQQEMQEMCIRPRGLGRPPGEGNGNPLQYPCLENSKDRSLGATVHGLQRVRRDWPHTPVATAVYKQEEKKA